MFSFAKNLLAIYFIMNECIIQRQAAVSGLLLDTCLHKNVMSFIIFLGSFFVLIL